MGTLAVVGAGLGRTGTNSLKVALEQLLGGRCYHMFELAERAQDMPIWQAAVRGEAVDWGSFLREYIASVDWPAAAFWRELAEANPRALVLLSVRDSPQTWWESMRQTIVPTISGEVPVGDPSTMRRRSMVAEMMTARFTPDWSDRDAAVAAYERHNEEVRRTVPRERLLEWRPTEGWGPLCAALGMPVPDSPFPQANTTADFRARQGLAGGG
ncbi:MAG TPA: sulfotransferase [Solirubrobacteraceae bacterium]|nr:sulfotransferase [Solirubrobacteraceae bacterium]